MPKKRVKVKKKKLRMKGRTEIPQPEDAPDTDRDEERTPVEETDTTEPTDEESQLEDDIDEQIKSLQEELEEDGKPETEEDVVRLRYRALSKVLRHGLRFSHPATGRDSWVECMGFLIGDVNNGLVEIKDAVPIVHGNLVEVEFDVEHYAKADEINQDLTDDHWVVGWYHTHPGHGLFLSSVDKINQSGYQVLNPKAVALVFDPSRLAAEKALADYIKLFRLKNPELRDGSDFVEVDAVEVDSSPSEVVDVLFESSELDTKSGPMVLEYGEDFEEARKAFIPEEIKEAERVEKEMKVMRRRIESMDQEIRTLRSQVDAIMDSRGERPIKGGKPTRTTPRSELTECPFCGYDSILEEDTHCGSCGKQL